jgi:hypothetical protein
VSRAAGEQGPLSIEERRQMQMESDPTLLPYKQRVERVWNILGWSGPGSSTALMEQYRKLGGDEDLLAIWWEIGERWVRPEDKEAMAKFTEMADMLERAAQMVSLKPPTRAQLVEWVQAQGENKVFQQEVQRTFGDTIYDLLAVYRAADSQEKRQLRTIYPEIDAYYKAKDAYGELHPIWAKYYNPESTTALSSSGGTGARRRATFGRGGGGGGARPETGDYILALGKRSTLDPNDLLRNLGGGGVGGIPRWPAGFAEAAGPLGDEIIKLASQGAPLSDSGAEFLADLGDRHKEWFEFARQILLTSRRAKDRAQGRAEQGYGLPPEIP